jgi:uncharacterized protein (TIGR04255 family)
MPKRFKNPPLVELAAELRWGSGGAAAMPQAQGQVIVLSPGQFEEFFMRFGSGVGALGYDRVERIVPPGFPTPPFQATYRFRRKEQEQEQGTTLYQVGGGVFTANITRPYHSWQHFRPVVERGTECLLNTRNPSEKEMPFAPAILRYIDAFSSKFTEGRTAATFLQDVLGFTIELPKALRSEMAAGADVKAVLQFSLPLQSGQQMNLALGEGMIGGEQALVMDISVLTETPIAANVSDIMAAFDASHDVIHRIFVGMTQKLFHIMEPVEGGKDA